MRRWTVLLGLVLILAAPVFAQPEPHTGSCINSKGVCYPASRPPIFGQVDPVTGCVVGDTWQPEDCPTVTPAPTIAPTPVPPEPPVPAGWWDLVKAFADKLVIWHGDAASVARILALLASFLGIVQAVKKALEAAAKWEWLVKLIPGLGAVLEFMAHGAGPVILNALITGGTLAVASISDGAFTLGELLAIIGACVGVDVLYRLVRKYLFPKSTV